MTDLTELKTRLTILEAKMRISASRKRYLELKNISESPDLWQDQENAVKTMSELEAVKSTIADFDDLAGLLEMSEDLEEKDLQEIESGIAKLEQQAVLSGEHDAGNALLFIHAGTGGVDAMDWALILERMFLRYVEQGASEAPDKRALSIDRSNWKVTLIDENRGEEAGIKSATLEVKGRYAFGLLKAEAGVHRLVRLSPFNAKNLRQTSFALVEVLPEIEKDGDVVINENDLRIDVFRAGGHGGQGVNTTDSAVRITHIPSGIVCVVQNERSQHQNKATAMTILKSRLKRLQEVQSSEETAMLKGEFKEGSWGNQIRSYVMQPYQMVKDHRTDYETANIQAVLDGDLGSFISAMLLSDK